MIFEPQLWKSKDENLGNFWSTIFGNLEINIQMNVYYFSLIITSSIPIIELNIKQSKFLLNMSLQ